MRALSRVLVPVVLAAVALIVPTAASGAVVTGRPVRIMPLGDSITWGVGSSTTSSYRLGLWQRLVTGAGLAVDFVGSGQSGALPDTDNEGHSGWRIEQLTASVDGWLASAQPDVVLLHIGTNDMNQNFDVAGAPARLGTLLDRIHADLPSVTVLVAQIVPALDAGVNARINAFNAAVPGVVAPRSFTRLVDLNNTITGADLADTLHPNDAGYTKMASLWYSALAAVLGGGRDWPLFRSGLEPGEFAPTWTDTVEASVAVGGYNASLSKMETGPRAETAHGGANALMYSGNDLSATQSYSYMRVYDVHLRIGPASVLTYWIYPQQTNGTYVAVDLSATISRPAPASSAATPTTSGSVTAPGRPRTRPPPTTWRSSAPAPAAPPARRPRTRRRPSTASPETTANGVRAGRPAPGRPTSALRPRCVP